MKEILIGTNNIHKLEEIQAILGNFCAYKTLSEFKINNEPNENGSNYQENAFIKANYYSQATGLPCLADDTGLEINHLQGKPGIHSARWAGVSGEGKYKANNEKILQQLQSCKGKDRSAKFVCVTVLAFQGKALLTCRGECPGHIITEIRDNHGFDYDPLFEVEGYGKTYAELDTEIKNKISHRAKALQKFMEEFPKLSWE